MGEADPKCPLVVVGDDDSERLCVYNLCLRLERKKKISCSLVVDVVVFLNINVILSCICTCNASSYQNFLKKVRNEKVDGCNRLSLFHLLWFAKFVCV